MDLARRLARKIQATLWFYSPPNGPTRTTNYSLALTQHDATTMAADDDSSAASSIEEPPLLAQAPELYAREIFFRQTRQRGKIFRTVRETYLRDDVGLGCHRIDGGDKLQTIHTATELLALLEPKQAVLVVDTNVLLHNLDVLEQLPNLVIPQTALQECRANRMVAYDRTVDLLRAPKKCSIFFPDPHHAMTATIPEGLAINDANDARIRNVAALFGEYLRGTKVPVVLLTDDAGSRELAKSQTLYQARSVRSWVQQLERDNPELSLLDRVAQFGSNTVSPESDAADIFPAHLDSKTMLQGIQMGTYHRGVLRSQSYEAASVTIRRGEERVVVAIQGSQHINRAVDGDVIAVALNPLDQWISVDGVADTKKSTSSETGIASETAEPTVGQLSNVPEELEAIGRTLRPTGRVVGIVRRNFSEYSGSIFEARSGETERERIASEFEREHKDGSMTCVFFAVDKKVPPILIRTTQRDRLLGQRIVVALDSWPAHSKFPLGHYVKKIGKAGTKEVETEVLLQEHSIPHEPFSAAVLACLPPDDYKIDSDNSPGREDLRHLPVLSIDPPNCKDIDDALHCTILPNGNWQVGVHIADVTHYVKAGTAIDLEAANRSTSTYLVNKRLDMLPGLLTTNLCSLKGNVDRYAFSVLWEVTPDADIVDVDFKKTMIHSIGALTYQQAQTMIEQPDDPEDIQACAVKRLAHLARKFRKRRIDAGALTLASPEVKFVLDSESLNPTDVQAYALLEANALVEEFMLLANVTVSKKILRHYPTLSVLRRHPSPNRAMFDGLISKAKSRGLSIDIDDSKKLADSLDAAQVESDPYINKLLRILSTRCMSPAQYFCSGEFPPTEWHHYGLAAPVYTHFTSPIRRYADVCVHRLLAAAIGEAPLPQHLSSKSYLHDLCANMNRRHRSAQMAGRASVQLHTLVFFSGEGGAREEDAYILDVETEEDSKPAFRVIVPRYGIEGMVLLPIEADDKNLTRYPADHRIVYNNSGTNISIQVFDKVRVRIWVREVQDFQRELVLDLLEPSLVSRKRRKKS